MVLLAFSAAGVVGYNGSGDVGITSGSGSSSASQAVGPNGTQWRMTFSESAAGPTNQSTGVLDHSFSDNSVEFSGAIQVPQPCYTLSAEVEEVSDNEYRFDISEDVVTQNGTAVPCADVISYRSFNASFSDDQAFRLEIVNEGETIETLEHPDYGSEPAPLPGPEKKGPVGSFIDWLTGLFSDEPERVQLSAEEGDIQMEEQGDGTVKIETGE
jgi:hypothetical protein